MGAFETGWGLELILWFQAWRTPLIEAAARVMHVLGATEFYLLALPAIYWAVDARLGRRLAVLVTLSMWANSLLKFALARPRPFMISPAVQNPIVETSYGLPSGHAQGSTTLWGGVALAARRGWVTALVAVFVVLMGLSRMALGVHYLQDVVLGTLVGLAALGVYAWAEPRLKTTLKAQSVWMQIGLVAAIAALMLAVHPGLVRLVPPPWIAPPLLDELASGPVTPIAGFLGLGIGFALELRFVRFSARGVWWKRLLRLVVGLAGIALLRFGLRALFAGLEPVLVFRLVRYSLIGLWGAFGAPWVFVRAGLAEGHADGD